IHIIVQQETESRHRHPAAVQSIQRDRYRNGVAKRIDHRIVRRVGPLTAREGAGPNFVAGSCPLRVNRRAQRRDVAGIKQLPVMTSYPRYLPVSGLGSETLNAFRSANVISPPWVAMASASRRPVSPS